MPPVFSSPGWNNLDNTPESYEKDNALFLKVFSGEVLTAFEESNIAKNLHVMRTIPHGKSASFPVLGKASARYHKRGDAILGSNQVPNSERVINIDDLLIADVMIYDLDDAKNHFDVRQEYSRQLGFALAREFDKRIFRVGVLAARSTGIIKDEPGGTVLKNPAFVNDGEALADGLFACAQAWDEKDVTDWDRNVVFRPAQYYLLAETTKVLNRDWGGRGSFADGSVLKVAGVSILKSNNVPCENVAAVEGERNTYSGDFSNTVGLALQKYAVGTVKLMDLAVEKSGSDFHIVYQADLMVARYSMGHGVLRPACAIELSAEA